MIKDTKKAKKEVIESILAEEFSLDGIITYNNEGEMLVGDPRQNRSEKKQAIFKGKKNKKLVSK